MIDMALALTRIDIRHAQAVVAGRLNRVIARQRRELAAETTDKQD
jgi:hypothetical protein